MSRQDLADAVGVNYQSVGFLERGDYNPSLLLAFAIGDFFKLPVEAIFAREPFRSLSEVVYGLPVAVGGRAPAGGKKSKRWRTERSQVERRGGPHAEVLEMQAAER